MQDFTLQRKMRQKQKSSRNCLGFRGLNEKCENLWLMSSQTLHFWLISNENSLDELKRFSSLALTCRNEHLRLFPGQSQLIGSSQPIVATVGDDVILPCQLQPAEDVSALAVEWTRSDLDPIYVHARRAGQDLPHVKHPSYKDRTSLSIDRLKQGNISLKLSKVKLSDGGKYRCFIPELSIQSFVELVVGKLAHFCICCMWLVKSMKRSVLVESTQLSAIIVQRWRVQPYFKWGLMLFQLSSAH